MRAWVLAAVLLVPFLTGCIGSQGDEGLTETGLGGEVPRIPAAPEPFTFLVCQGDELVPLEGGHDAGCNHQANADGGPGAEVSLAANPTDPLNLVGGSKDFTLGEDARCGQYNVWSGVYTSQDGGRTWAHDLLPGHPGDDRETALSQYACGSDPVLAFAPNGTLYYSSIHVTQAEENEGPFPPQTAPVTGYPIENAGIAVTRSLDGGQTWEDPVVHGHKEAGEGIFDKQWIAVDPTTGQIYISYIDTGEGAFFLQRSDDGGLTFTDPMRIFEPEDSAVLLSGPQFGQIAVDHAGTVHFTYWFTDDTGETAGIWHRASMDQGETFSERHAVAPFYPVFDLEVTHKYRIVPNPALAVDPQDGTLYVAYPFYADDGSGNVPSGNMDAYVVASHDGGTTWEAPVKVNDELAAPANGQWMQAIQVGPDGTVHTTWMDYRDDPAGQEAYVYYAYSQDQGRTWSDNQRVSDVPFDGEGGYHQSGAGTIGDYMGLAVTEHAVHPFWADTRNGQNDVFAAIIPS
ncbi:MAG: sialidase family protein [Candidatus Thermoplasmatota archaeon]|nr:sialidase family protein [Candidatus Thermoplasmatota archaeon]